MKRLVLILATTLALFAAASSVDLTAPQAAPQSSTVEPGDGGTSGMCVGGLLYVYVSGYGFVPIGRC